MEDLAIYEKLRLDYQDLQRKLETSEGRNRELQEQLEATQNEKQDTKAKLEAKLEAGQLKTKADENQQLRSQNEALRKLVQNAESHNEELRKLVQDGNDAKESLDANELKWHTKFVELHKGLQRAEDDLEAMKEVNQTLECQLKTKVDENLQLHILVQNANDAKRNLEGYSQKLYLECSDLRKECFGLHKECFWLLQRIKRAEHHNLEAMEKENADSVIQTSEEARNERLGKIITTPK